jgi:hypothetical protein
MKQIIPKGKEDIAMNICRKCIYYNLDLHTKMDIIIYHILMIVLCTQRFLTCAYTQESCCALFSQLSHCDYNFRDDRLDSFQDLSVGGFIQYSSDHEYE